ncbi:hypothetical protein F0U60_45270 [Archangium minus]|uniref:Uncharacterized protein n=1 Tax=Archangium minus TaxID=83450 RepID=A0ABY9X565_9BACT|nr:hypothetical protein F0U60_45270 [Archangium minus]
MKPELTVDALVQLVHRYYPAGMEKEDPRYLVSEETQRLQSLLQLNVGRSPAWNDFVQRLRGQFPDCSVWDTTVPMSDPCYSCRVSLPGFVAGAPIYDSVVCLLSQLAPVYALYASHMQRSNPPELKSWLRFPPFPPEFQSHEVKLAGLIESTFGFTRLSNDVLFTPVPDLVPRTVNFGLGDARLIDCLMTEHRW